MVITGTYDLVADPQWKNLVLQEIYLECDTTLAPVTINLFPISNLLRFWNVKIYISDIYSNAGVNNIIINSSGLDFINRKGITDFIIDKSGGCCAISIISDIQWSVINQSYDYQTIQEEGVSLPQRRILNVTGAGAVAFDNNGVTELFISGVSSGNFGIFNQTVQSTPITNTTTENSLIATGIGTLSVPPNGFTVGDGFLVTVVGFLNCANNQELQIKIKSGSVIFADTGLIPLSNSTNQSFNLQVYFTVRAIGAVGVASIVTGGDFSYTKNVGSSFDGITFNTMNNSTFDTTILNTLSITAQWGASNPNNIIYSDIFTLTKTF
jgi:hypothetical protein